ncbi:MAG TPA: GNAT family N-acetyltransferase [Candidatus Didemnitutus sp.]|nr:GNAT family N-acetyltransferase [Candidatus Didemnitutus sp.]
MIAVLDRPGVRVRDLMPADLPASASLHVLAFPTAAISLLGHETAQRFHEYLNSSSEFVGLAAFEGEKLAGICFGGSVRDIEGAFLRRNFRFVTARIFLRPWLLLRPSFRERTARGLRLLLSVSGRRAGREIRPAGAEAVRSFGIRYLAVAPSYQGRGVAKLLLSECENVARTRGFSTMDLTVLTDNHPAIGLYEQMGWRRLEENGAWRGFMFKSLA